MGLFASDRVFCYIELTVFNIYTKNVYYIPRQDDRTVFYTHFFFDYSIALQINLRKNKFRESTNPPPPPRDTKKRIPISRRL